MADTEVLAWIGLAEKDLASARHLLTLRPRPVEVICFLCQQSAEKILKAMLVGKDSPVPRTHDLVTVAQMMLKAHPEFKELLPQCVRLSAYAVKTRYPYSGDLPENADEIAIADAERIMNTVRAELNTSST
jgi:HEPN domain-containing protein